MSSRQLCQPEEKEFALRALSPPLQHKRERYILRYTMKPYGKFPRRLLAIVVILPLLACAGLLFTAGAGHAIDLNIQNRIETYTPQPDFSRPPARETEAPAPRSGKARNASRKRSTR